jgi:hypothetical protein
VVPTIEKLRLRAKEKDKTLNPDMPKKMLPIGDVPARQFVNEEHDIEAGHIRIYQAYSTDR